MLSFQVIAGVLLVAVLIWFWHDSLGTRERANFAAQSACERARLQFLDGTVAFARLSVARNEYGRLAFRRTYVFDYTAGTPERMQGFIVLLGHRVEAIGFADDGNDDSRTWIHPHDVHKPAVPADDKVLDLNELRKRRRSTTSPVRKSSDTWH
ncbi:MAG TPA: DUF3301 domain-containing protein [Steroidobacteraceae bacterium]|nr:DUF3301 domain-containing protein [Steroidobacteraceae bacterium]